jgi:hypothetical protein
VPVETNDHLASFRESWKKEFGEEISEADAKIRMNELFELYQLIAKQQKPKE